MNGDGDTEVPPPVGGGEFKMPPLEELLKSIETMDGISDEQKEELKNSLLMSQKEASANEFLSNMQQETLHTVGQQHDFLILFLLLAIIISIFVFFGYKLIKSLRERERRREEKRRLKQQKKKK